MILAAELYSKRVTQSARASVGAPIFTVTLSDFVSLCATIVAKPIATPLTTPLATVAFVISLLDQVTARSVRTIPVVALTVASSCTVLPTPTTGVPGDSTMEPTAEGGGD